MANDIPISDRELEILRLVATGASNQQIAQQLNISINTVKVHMRNIFSKIGVVSRTEATIYALSNGLVTLESGVALAVALQPEVEDSDRAEILDDQAKVLSIEEEHTLPNVDIPLILPADVPLTPHSETLLPPTQPAARNRKTFIFSSVGALALLIILALSLWQLRGSSPDQLPTAIPTSIVQSATQRWLSHTAMPNPRADFALAAYDQEHKLYVIGGQVNGIPSAAIDRFDPESNVWVSLTDKPSAVSDVGAVSLYGNIYVPGGIDAHGKVRNILEIFDPREQRWHLGAAIPAPRSHYALVVWEGRLYLIGGWNGTQTCAEVYIYDPQTNSWSEGPSLASPRQSAGAVVASGQIYVIGGSNKGNALRESLRLDPTAKNAGWQAIAPLPVSVATPGAVAPVGTLLAFDPSHHQGFQYDPQSDSWKNVAIPDDVLISSNVTLLGVGLYFIADNTAPVPGLVNEYRVIFTVFVPGSGSNPSSP
ncbi:MAG: LuxR family transcriptional regulator [Oscillochloris sp.]|nr:LuxR family transcriptional regulator [Oscillochloris sp.]